MKKYFYLVALGAVLVSAGCSKEKQSGPEAVVSVEGYWFGFYKINGTAPTYNTALLVRPGGTLRFYELGQKTDTVMLADGLKLDGTWTFSENVFQFQLAIGTESATASLVRSVDFTKLNGSYSANGVAYGIMEYRR